MKSKYVSIIVPTFQDWKRLALCVEALTNQTFPRDSFEVLIVNNDPRDSMPPDFALPEGFKILVEEKPGSYAARNTGLRAAKGEIIGFTDADCIPNPNWIMNAVEYFARNESCSRIAGKIAIFYKTAKPTMAELYNTMYSFPQEIHVKKTGTSVTGNLFTYKHVFDQVGFFDENLLSLGDLAWGRVANKAGFKVHYVPNVIVKHPARSLPELIKKEKRVGGGQGIRARGKKVASLLRFLYEYKPRLDEFRFILNNGKELNAIEKMKILLLRHYLLGVRSYEKRKVQTGKDPNRA